MFENWNSSVWDVHFHLLTMNIMIKYIICNLLLIFCWMYIYLGWHNGCKDGLKVVSLFYYYQCRFVPLRIVIYTIVLGGCGILNSVAVSVFSQPKTEVSVSGLVLALKCAKIRKSARSAFYSPGPHLATRFYFSYAIQNGGFSSRKMCVVLFYSK